MIKCQDEGSGYTTFASSDSSDTSQRPCATIFYINNSGLESYWNYESQDAGRAGTGYINDYNGNLVLVHSDLSMTGDRLPISISHIYNSNQAVDTLANTDNRYGIGWRLNLSQRIDSQTISDVAYSIFTDEDGTKHFFKHTDGTNTYSDELQLGYSLSVNSDGTYLLTDKKDNKLGFDAAGLDCI